MQDGEHRGRVVGSAARSECYLLAGTAFAVLIVEVTMTRVFSLKCWHHMVGLAIALPFVGFGAAGSILSMPRVIDWRQRLSSDGRARFLSTLAVIYGFLQIAFFWAAVHVPIDAQASFDWLDSINVVIFVFLCAVPFCVAGAIICECLAGVTKEHGLRYAADLGGAALGVGVVLLALEPVGAPSLVHGAATVVLVSALAVVPRVGRRRWLIAGLALCLLAFTFVEHLWLQLTVPPAPSKELWARTILHGPPEFTRWHPLCRIDVGPEAQLPPWTAGGISRRFGKIRVPTRWVFQDGGAPTQLIRPVESPEEAKWPGLLVQALPYAIKEQPRVAIIGVGGGPDVWVARHHGARSVRGIEIHPITVSLLREHYFDYTGGLFAWPGVDIRCDEGRHFAASSREQFDIIQLSGVDTFAAALSGAQAMSESYLYTKDALSDFYARLAPGGVLSYARWLFSPPRECLRLLLTMEAVLAECGVERPEACLVVVAREEYPEAWAEVLMRRGAFSETEIERIEQWAKERGFSPLYLPGRSGNNVFHRALGKDKAAFIDDYAYDIRPCTDDRPFFFNFFKLSSLAKPPEAGRGGYAVTQRPTGLIFSLVTVVSVFLLSLCLIVLPLLPRLSNLGAVRERWSLLGYFSCIGVGFMLFELAVIQKTTVILGGPVRAMGCVLITLLLGSGGGALTLTFWRRLLVHPRRFLWIVAAVLLFEGLFFSSWLGDAPLQWSLHIRTLVVVLALLPAGFVMGMPFPLGLSLVSERYNNVAPWCWAANACASTLGAALTPLLALGLGFSTCFAIAVVLYAIAAIVIVRAFFSSRD